MERRRDIADAGQALEMRTRLKKGRGMRMKCREGGGEGLEEGDMEEAEKGRWKRRREPVVY